MKGKVVFGETTRRIFIYINYLIIQRPINRKFGESTEAEGEEVGHAGLSEVATDKTGVIFFSFESI